MSKQKLGYLEDKPNKDSVYAQPRGYDFTYYLSDCVQDSHQYHELLQLLDTSGEQDTIRIVINNDGGEAGTCVQLVDHIRNSKALVIGHMSGNAFSAAGVIWLACHQQSLAEHSMMMIHHAIGGVMGKYSDMATQIIASNKRIKYLYEDIFKHFLSSAELEQVLRGEDLWLCFDEIVERLENRQKLYEAEAYHNECKQEAEMEAAFNEQFPLPSEQVLKKLKPTQLRKLILDQAYLDENEQYVEYPVKE